MADSIPLPYQFYLPWWGHKSLSGSWAAQATGQASNKLGGGDRQSGGAVNAEIFWDRWFDAQTYKLAVIYSTSTISGIHTHRIDGVSVGTTDSYSSPSANNVYSEITGVVVATAGLKSFSQAMLTKNASSTNYYYFVNSWAWVMTSTPSTPSGTFDETPGYIIPVVPWAGTRASTATSPRAQDSTGLGTGYSEMFVQSEYQEWAVWAATGTHKVGVVGVQATSRAITTVQFDGVTISTHDFYNASTVLNHYLEATGVVVTAGFKVLRITNPTKNASSTNYTADTYSLFLARTGA